MFDNDGFQRVNSTNNQINVLFTVEDSGIGIREEDYDKLFKVFGKLRQKQNVNPTGIGLGLTICNKILN